MYSKKYALNATDESNTHTEIFWFGWFNCKIFCSQFLIEADTEKKAQSLTLNNNSNKKREEKEDEEHKENQLQIVWERDNDRSRSNKLSVEKQFFHWEEEASM